jgi:salicylate 5-hydroxylase large subunit
MNNTWNSNHTGKIPFWVYTNAELYQQELDKIFYGQHWLYVGLACEIPNAGDFKLSWVGEREVIVSRDHDDNIHVFENRCAHRGVKFCQKNHGNTKHFLCPYHQWRYKLNGDLHSLPFQHGVNKDGEIKGGMPKDFDIEQHGLNKLRVATLHGMIFATFSDKTESIEEYFGPRIMPWIDRIFKGRELVLLGYNRQQIPGNWKLMMENIKDPYHPGLLHTWFVTFGLFRADQKSRMVQDKTGRHAVMLNIRGNQGVENEVTKGVESFKPKMKLNDPRLLDVETEAWWTTKDPFSDNEIMPTNTMLTLFPSVIIQQQVNSMSTRHIVPKGNNEFEFTWTHFGFKDDSKELTERRLNQSNLFGPAGFVSADDGEVIELSQHGFNQAPVDSQALAELGGTDIEQTDHMVTETLIRGMYQYYRKIMGV